MGQPTAPPLPTAGATPGATTAQMPNLPGIAMDPVTQASILQQIQRSGWNPAQPTPDVQVTNDPISGKPSAVIKGWNMVITDPKTGTNETVKLAYSPGGKQPWGIVDAPKSLPTDPAVSGRTTVKTSSGVYSYDPKTQTTTYLMPGDVPNMDDEISKAVQRQDREAERNEKEANAAAGRGYQTTSDYQKMAAEAQRNGQSAAELQEKIRQFDITQGESTRRFDIEQKAKDAKDAQDILQSKATVGQIQANTTNIGATTDKTRQEIEQNAAKFPGELASQAATTAGIEARTAGEKQTQAINAAPKVAEPGKGLYNYQLDPLTGKVSPTGINQEYMPKTQAEIAARVGQIQSAAQAKQAEVQAKVGQNGYTADQALAEFNNWWGQNVEPHMGTLQAAQQDAAFQQAKDAAQARQQAMQTSLGAGTQAISAFTAENAARVGSNYGDVMNQIMAGKNPKDIQNLAGAFTYKAPPVGESANQAVQGTMNQIGGNLPGYQGLDIAGMLNRTKYQPGGAPPPPTGPAPGPAAVPVPPPPPPPPQPMMVSSGTQGPGNPWANGTPPPGTTWQNPQVNPFDYLNYGYQG